MCMFMKLYLTKGILRSCSTSNSYLDQIPFLSFILLFIHSFFHSFFFFSVYPQHMEFPGSDPSHRCDLSHSTGSLTHCCWVEIEPTF